MPDTGKVRMNMREGVRKEGGYRDAPASKTVVIITSNVLG